MTSRFSQGRREAGHTIIIASWRTISTWPHPALFFFDFLRQLAKLFGLPVARFYLQLCELSRVLRGQDRRQGFQFLRYFAGVIGFFQHQMFKFPDCLVVIHRPRFGRYERVFYFRVTSLSTNSE